MDSEVFSTSVAAGIRGRPWKYASEQNARERKYAARRAKTQAMAAAETTTSRHHRNAKITRLTYIILEVQTEDGIISLHALDNDL